VRVDLHRRPVVERHAGGFEAQALRVGDAAGRKEHGVGLELLAARQRGHQRRARAPRVTIDDFGVEPHVDAGLAHLAREKLAHVFIEAVLSRCAGAAVASPGRPGR
jgi:hypothetical protein